MPPLLDRLPLRRKSRAPSTTTVTLIKDLSTDPKPSPSIPDLHRLSKPLTALEIAELTRKLREELHEARGVPREPFDPRRRKRRLTLPLPADVLSQRTRGQSGSGLMRRVPEEVRKMVWEHVVGAPDVYVCVREGRLVQTREDGYPYPTPARGLLNLSLTCRRIYSETIPLVYAQPTFHIGHAPGSTTAALPSLPTLLLPHRIASLRHISLAFHFRRADFTRFRPDPPHKDRPHAAHARADSHQTTHSSSTHASRHDSAMPSAHPHHVVPTQHEFTAASLPAVSTAGVWAGAWTQLGGMAGLRRVEALVYTSGSARAKIAEREEELVGAVVGSVRGQTRVVLVLPWEGRGGGAAGGGGVEVVRCWEEREEWEVSVPKREVGREVYELA